MTQTDHSATSLSIGAPAESDSLESLQAPFGRRRFIAGVGAAAGAAALATVLPTGVARALPAEASKFVALPESVRVADTDPNEPAKFYTEISSDVIRIPLAGKHGIPATATAVVATVTLDNRHTSGNVATVYPSGTTRPGENSNLNVYLPSQATANMAVVKLGNGSVDFWRQFPGRVIFEVLGYYEPVTSDVAEGRFIPLPSPTRALQPFRLKSKQFTTVDVTSQVGDPTASAVVINLTVDQVIRSSFYYAYAYADAKGVPIGPPPPRKSSLNVAEATEMRAVSVVVPIQMVDNRQRINVYADYEATVIVDVFGYITGPNSPVASTGLFVPSAPIRIFDSRNAGPEGRLWKDWIQEIEVPSDAAQNGGAIVANITMTREHQFNLLKVQRARDTTNPDISNLNAMRGWIDVPNLAYSKISTLADKQGAAAFQIRTVYPTHIVVDYAGYFLGQPTYSSGPKPINPPPGAAPIPWKVVFNKPMTTAGGNVMPLTVDGDAVAQTNKGLLWHWQGTGAVGEAGAHVAVFGHRTEAGGPLYRLNTLGPGDQWTVDTADGRRYTYTFAYRELTNADTLKILDATKRLPGNTFSFIACTKGTGADPFLPTSLKYRIVVTGTEVGWRPIALCLLRRVRAVACVALITSSPG